MNRTNIELINLFRISMKKYIKSIIYKNGCYIIFIKSVNDLIIFTKIIKSLTLFNYKMLIEIFAVDYPSKLLRFELNYIFRSLNCKGNLILKLPLSNKIIVPSLSQIYDSANWLEREVWDLFGLIFSGNSDLRRILTDYGFKGHPLRKDFPLTGFVEIRYEDSKQMIITENLEMSQEFRFFDFQSSWISKLQK